MSKHSDVMVQCFGDVAFVSNGDLAWPLIRDDARSAARLHATLGAPALMMAFCHDDRAGHHGYAVFERGERVRTRRQEGDAALRVSGTPLAFEQHRLQQGVATSRLLRDGLETLFGVCPWETLLTPTWRFFRLGAERDEPGASAAARVLPARPAGRKPWWQLRLS